jgi:transcriptional regulator with XRE-family HTH domain
MTLRHEIGERLKEERERLGLGQKQVTELTGASKKTQYNYENGVSAPDGEFLAALAAAGADVQYILTGVRSSGAPAVPKPAEAPATEAELSQREKVLVAKWRMLPAAEQDDIEEIVEKIEQAQALKRKHGKAPRKAS